MNIDLNKIIDYAAQGNLTIIIMGSIIIFLLAWIKYEKSIRSLFKFMFSLHPRKTKEEKMKEKNSLEIRINMFFESMDVKISQIEALHLSKDVGRNALYHYLVRAFLTILRDECKEAYQDYKKGSVSKEMFCSYQAYHYKRIDETKRKFYNTIAQKLVKDSWKSTDITYINSVFLQWISPHISLLSELVSTCRFPEGVVMAWWVVYYEMYMNLEKFSVAINGRITGKTFEDIIIGKPR